MRELIQAYQQRGGTVFISSHILSEIERAADRIGILDQGRLLVEDSLAGLRRRLVQNQHYSVELEEVPERAWPSGSGASPMCWRWPRTGGSSS